MISPQAFFESSCLIDVGIGSAKHADLSNETDVDCEQEAEAEANAKLLLEELRKRLRSIDGGCFKMSHESKERLIELLSS